MSEVGKNRRKKSAPKRTGVDLSAAQWDEVVSLVREHDLVPFLDFAYQGFGEGIEEDAVAVRAFKAAGRPRVISSSFSKSFSLYRERVGVITIVTADADEAKRVTSQLKRIIRTNYSSPSSHGGQIVGMVLGNPELRAKWESELTEMRVRIQKMRTLISATSLPFAAEGAPFRSRWPPVAANKG